jgi:hypothetical protein
VPDSEPVELHDEVGKGQKRLERFASFYTLCAVTLFSTLLLLGVLTAGLASAYAIKDALAGSNALAGSKGDPTGLFRPDGAPVDTGKRTSYQLSWFDFNSTAELGERHVAEVLDDFWMLARLGFVHQPWVGFSEPLFEGTHVSVVPDPMGIPSRRTINPVEDPSLPVVHVYTFGGSTTFGYQVADQHTWPSELSAILNERAHSGGLGFRVEVTNYGRGFFDTSQEAALAIDLIKSGRRPDLAIFMDGVNLGLARDVPWFTAEMTAAFWDAQHPSARVGMEHLGATWFGRLPFGRLMASMQRRWSSGEGGGHEEGDAGEAPLIPSEQEHVNRLIQRFRMNREITTSVLAAYDAGALYFIQPDPVYNYPPDWYRLELPVRFWRERERRKAFHERMETEDGVILLTGLFAAYGVESGRKAVLDDVHYTAAFNRFLAEHVAREIDLEALAPQSGHPLPTGVPRADATAPERVITPAERQPHEP